MNRPIHTPGPVRVFSALGRPEIVTDRPTAYETQDIVTQFAQPNADSNARLVSAAYNAFDSAARKLGINAVEFAERMRDGGLAELAESHGELLADIDGLKSDFAICREISRSSYARRSRVILARVKGAAT
jgi:hypothetical protein